MKLGCLGCLLLIIILVAVAASVGAVIFFSTNILATPELQPASFSKGEGYAAQQKLYEALARGSGRSGRQESIVLTEREANAFLYRHLQEAAGIPFSPLGVRFLRGEAILQGQTALKNLLQAPPFAQLLPYIPDKRLDQRVWVTVRGRVTVKAGRSGGARYGDVTLSEFALGRQPLGSSLVYVMLGPSGAGLLNWQVPSGVESIEFDEGRVTIRTR